jgi:hypothetical protein
MPMLKDSPLRKLSQGMIHWVIGNLDIFISKNPFELNLHVPSSFPT